MADTKDTTMQEAPESEQTEQTTDTAANHAHTAPGFSADADQERVVAADAQAETGEGADRKPDAQADEAQQEAEPEAAEAGTNKPPAQTQETDAPPAPDAAQLQGQLIDAELRAAAAIAGIPANRIPYAVRLADKAKAQDAQDLAAFATEQMQQIIQDLPELAASASGTGSAGNHARTPTVSPEDNARRAFAGQL